MDTYHHFIVQITRLELVRPFGHHLLKMARLPITTYLHCIKKQLAEAKGLEPLSRFITDTIVFKTIALPIMLRFHLISKNVMYNLYTHQKFMYRKRHFLYISLAVRKRFELLNRFSAIGSLANFWFQPLTHLTILLGQEDSDFRTFDNPK